MKLLDIKNLFVARGAGEVLHGVNIDVVSNEIVAVLGPNGAGKTTLLETIVGLHRPLEGDIIFDGENLAGRKPQQIANRGIRLVPEGRRLFGALSVAENLQIGAEGAGLTDWRWVLDIFPQLGDRLENSGGALSGGEQQMVAIARALVAKPRLMILDEPSWGLAPLLVEAVLKTVEDIQKLGTTIVIVEQNAEAALKICSRAYVLSGGQVVRSMTRQEGLDQPAIIHEAYFG
jgi:branched-chain amino acid transport system ATP-binding protein|tara:strand:- start:67 stop:762 length:696 start_codon:yes stop_codon:yes gene_type:complete